jgi:metal-responsive CopG/Arc/MetJ family transcriptional regulator
MKQNIFSAAPKTDMVSRTFHLHQEQLKPLQETAKELGVSQSEIVRRAISLFITEYQKRAGAGTG